MQCKQLFKETITIQPINQQLSIKYIDLYWRHNFTDLMKFERFFSEGTGITQLSSVQQACAHVQGNLFYLRSECCTADGITHGNKVAGSRLSDKLPTRQFHIMPLFSVSPSQLYQQRPYFCPPLDNRHEYYIHELTGISVKLGMNILPRRSLYHSICEVTPLYASPMQGSEVLAL